MRQLIDLVISADWTTFFAERDNLSAAAKSGDDQQLAQGTAAKYVRVRASHAALLIEKVIEFDKKGTSFFSTIGGRSVRADLYNTILKKLRNFSDWNVIMI